MSKVIIIQKKQAQHIVFDCSDLSLYIFDFLWPLENTRNKLVCKSWNSNMNSQSFFNLLSFNPLYRLFAPLLDNPIGLYVALIYRSCANCCTILWDHEISPKHFFVLNLCNNCQNHYLYNHCLTEEHIIKTYNTTRFFLNWNCRAFTVNRIAFFNEVKPVTYYRKKDVEILLGVKIE